MTGTRGALLSPDELSAWKGMLEAHSTLVARLDAELTREHDLPLTSYEVLMYLVDADRHRLRMGELADRLLLSRSGVTRLVDRLERQGLVERQPCEDDARGFYAVLTQAGQRKVEAARPTHLAGVREHFLGRLDAGERKTLSGIWPKILED
ncbi:MAG TPA: MarR family transcriptional regulator [Solirubrobacterales bacterium]|nr:MarR family transcriptional regulator [Solirubrobacterales bacterium]